MHKIGDEKVVNHVTYVYTGYDTWEEKSQRNQLTNRATTNNITSVKFIWYEHISID